MEKIRGESAASEGQTLSRGEVKSKLFDQMMGSLIEKRKREDSLMADFLSSDGLSDNAKEVFKVGVLSVRKKTDESAPEVKRLFQIIQRIKRLEDDLSCFSESIHQVVGVEREMKGEKRFQEDSRDAHL